MSLVQEVVNFSQVDLVPEDVMLLDTWDAIFLWVGTHANREEKKQSINLAFSYLRTGIQLFEYFSYSSKPTKYKFDLILCCVRVIFSYFFMSTRILYLLTQKTVGNKN